MLLILTKEIYYFSITISLFLVAICLYKAIKINVSERRSLVIYSLSTKDRIIKSAEAGLLGRSCEKFVKLLNKCYILSDHKNDLYLSRSSLFMDDVKANPEQSGEYLVSKFFNSNVNNKCGTDPK